MRRFPELQEFSGSTLADDFGEFFLAIEALRVCFKVFENFLDAFENYRLPLFDFIAISVVDVDLRRQGEHCCTGGDQSENARNDSFAVTTVCMRCFGVRSFGMRSFGVFTCCDGLLGTMGAIRTQEENVLRQALTWIY